MDGEKENTLIMIASRWEAICDILNGQEPSDFMLSFTEVRQVFDLYRTSQPKDSADAKLCDNFKCVFEGECRNWNICEGFIQHG